MISVITATFNRVDTIRDCLASVRAQSGVDIDHVIIDGASADGTREVLSEFEADFGDFVSEPDRGVYDALNKGILRAKGDIVGFLHADDVFADSHALSRVNEAFADPKVQGVYGDLCYVQKEDISKVVRYWKSGEFTAAKLAQGWMPPHPTLYLRKSWYDRIGGFDIRYQIAADYLSVLRVFSDPGFKVVYVPQVLVNMRVGGVSNRSLRTILRKSREDYRALRETGVGGIGTLAFKNVSKVGQFLHKAPVG